MAVENTKPGTTAWQLTNPATMFQSNDLNPADYANAEIQGYASLTSVNQGGSIDFHVRTINTNSYTLSVFRMGWYNGTGGRLMLGPITLPGVVQPMPPAPVYPPAGTGIVECNWSVSYNLKVPSDWVSGVYLVKLSLSAPVKESYIVFVVRDDARNSPILFQSSVTTYQAYNEWGGSSLYTTTPDGDKTGVKVSFNRPYWRNYGAGDFVSLTGAPGYEMQMDRWLERQGYDVTYATDVDTHENPNTVLTHKVFLIVGHDEYWSRNMRDNVIQGRDDGIHLGIFAGNVLYWQIRFEKSSTGVDDRTMVAYKDLASMDPISDPSLVTTRWRDLGEPEGDVLGVQYNLFSAPTVSDIVVTNASHWLFDGTGVTNGTIFPNVEGYETDSLFPPSGATVLAHSPYPRNDPQVFGDMTIYTAASGALVFATGTIEWSLGLDDFPPSQGIVPAMQQVTANFLSRALQAAPPPTLTSVNPNSGGQGQNLNSVILAGNKFQSGATCNFGAGITVNSCVFDSPTQLTANITIGATATLGSRNVAVTNRDSQSSTLSNGFTVTTAGMPPPPALSSVNPNSGARGQNLTGVILSGNSFQSGATCAFGAGITVNSCTFNSPTQLTASIGIGSTAALGSRNVTVTNPDSQSSTLSNAFSVTAISLIQKATFSRQPTSGGTVTLNLAKATGAGNALIVGVSFWPLDISSVTDASGDVFTRGLPTSIYHDVSGSATYTNFYYAKSTAGGATSLTLNFSGGSTYLLVAVAEVAGLDPSAPLDKSGFHDSLTPTAAWSSAAVTTTAANEYLFSWAATQASNPFCSNPASGWTVETQFNDSSGATVCLLDGIVAVTGSYQTSVTASSAQNYVMELVTFKSGSSSSPPPPTLTSVNPTSGGQGQNLNGVALTGSKFQSGATCAFGAGITVNSCTFNSATQLTASISIGATAVLGSRNVTVTNPDGQSGTLSNGFTVTTAGPPPPPGLTSVNPNSGAQGQNFSSVTLTGNSFQSGATCSFGAGITVNSCAFNSATQLTANITIGAAATVGSRNVTVTNPDSQSGTLSNGFTVTTAGPPPPPVLSSVNPNSGAQGQNLTSVILTGNSFQSGATCAFGAGITVNSCTFNSATQLTANITIGATATVGSRNVTVTNPDSQSSTLSNAFSVTVLPAISLIQKATFSRQPTSTGTVTLTLPKATGAGHTLIVGVTFWPLDISSVTDGSGDTFTRGLATSIYHSVSGSATYNNFYYAKSTAGGATSLTLNFSGGSTYLLVAVAEVAGLDPSSPLDQSGFHDSTAATAAWSSAAVTTTTANEYLFSWAATQASNPSCSNPASGWTLESQTNDSNGATICLLDGIATVTGSYQAAVTASSAQNYAMELATFKGGSSSSPPPPKLISLNPNSGAQGQNLSSVTLTGNSFQSGATCAFGAGITVNSCTFNSATQLTANITIGATATLGSRTVTVTNPDSQSSTLSNGFSVTTAGPPPPPVLSSVNPNSGAQGQNLSGVTLTGNSFQSGATCAFGAGITVNSCTFNSATQLTASISIGAAATLGSRSVTVTNPDSQSSTLSNAFSVTVLPAVSLIQKATFARQPTSGGAVTLTLPKATGAGHTVIVGVSFWPLDISSVTDGSGDTFTRGLATSIYHDVSGSATYNNFYYAKSTAGGTTSLTLNFSGGSTYLLVAVAEVAGLDPSSPVDQSGFHDSTAATAAWSSAAVTTTTANEYLFSWAATQASNPSCSNPASGWTLESQTNDSNGATICLLDGIASVTGSYQTSVTASSAQNYAMELATFR